MPVSHLVFPAAYSCFCLQRLSHCHMSLEELQSQTACVQILVPLLLARLCASVSSFVKQGNKYLKGGCKD